MSQYQAGDLLAIQVQVEGFNAKDDKRLTVLLMDANEVPYRLEIPTALVYATIKRPIREGDHVARLAEPTERYFVVALRGDRAWIRGLNQFTTEDERVVNVATLIQWDPMKGRGRDT